MTGKNVKGAVSASLIALLKLLRSQKRLTAKVITLHTWRIPRIVQVALTVPLSVLTPV